MSSQQRRFQRLHDEAQKLGITEHELWTRDSINDALRQRGNQDLGAFYFGASRAIDGTTAVPLPLWRSAGADVRLVGRDREVKQIRETRGDLLVAGQPGVGKTRLAVEAGDIRFLNLRPIERQFFVLKDYPPTDNYSTCYVLTADVDRLYADFRDGLKQALGRVPSRGIPRIGALNDMAYGVRQFVMTDPAAT